MNRRRLLDRLVPVVMGALALAAAGVFFAILAAIIFRGLPAMRLSFLTEQMRGVGAEGGILFNLLGTLILIATALAVAAPLAVGLALVHSVYLSPGSPGRRRLTLFLQVLNGVPSILFGLFGLILFVGWLGMGKSWLTGGILLGLMITPVVTVSLAERIEALPSRYIEAAAGLGLTRAQIIWHVILRQSRSGLVTGSLLGLARAAGETAPVMFTATVFAGATLPRGISESPVLSLPYHIFILAQDSAEPAVKAKMWGTAIVLLAITFTSSLIALPLRLRAQRESSHA